MTIDIFARCACILLIVFHHSSKLGIDGAAATLLALTGFIFGRFQPAKVQQNGFFAATFRTLRKIVPLYMIVMLIYFALKRDWFWPNFLFYANFTKGYDDGQTVIAVYWFIESYVHLVIAGSLLLALPPVQRFQARYGFVFGMLLVAVGVLAHGMVLPDHPVPVAERHSPFWIFYIFALGWAATFARSSWQKAILSVTMIVVLALFPPHATKVGYYVIVPVYLLLLWANRIEFGSERLTSLINRVAQSSLYIYLLHPFVFLPLLKIVGPHTIAGFPVSVPLALFVTVPVTAWAGIELHHYSDRAIAWIGRWWSNRRIGDERRQVEGSR